MSLPAPPADAAPGALAPVGLGSLARAMGLFAVLAGVLAVHAALEHKDSPSSFAIDSAPIAVRLKPPAALPPPIDVVDLRLQPDGYATLQGITFSVEELPVHLAEMRNSDGLPAVRVRAPRDLALPVLMKVMQDLKAAAVPQTAVELLPEP